MALLAGNANAAVKLSDLFDGNWRTQGEGGRGISIMIAPREDGSTFFFGALFTYDDAGEPTWLILFAPFLEHQFESTEVEVARVTGGAFGFPFDPDAIVEDTIGSAHIRVDSCKSIFIDLDMDDDSGFPDVTLGDFFPIDGAADTCAYQEEFTECPDFSTPSGIVPRGCNLSGVYNEDIVLTNEITWVLNGLVQIGDDNDNSAVVYIEPGTVIIGAGDSSDYLYVNPGSRIHANGTPWAPIVLTSPQDGFSAEFGDPLPGDVGGIVLSGNAPTNACPEAPFNCFSEFDESLRFGGDDPHDSCGEISYFQVRYAGYVFAANREVNSFTFQACGDGTIAHHLQAYRGKDDGVEFFGGTNRVRYFVVTEGGDDGVDWDLGFSGKLQYVVVYHGVGFGEDFGIEGASNPDSFDASPRATPVVANATFLGNGRGRSGILFKEGSGGIIYNTVVQGFATSCFEMASSPSTYNAAGTPAAPNTDVTALNGVIVNCDTNFKTADGAPYTAGDFFASDAFENNETTDPLLDGVMPMTGSPALEGGVVPDDEWVDHTSYRGAFDGTNNWMLGWTHRPLGDN